MISWQGHSAVPLLNNMHSWITVSRYTFELSQTSLNAHPGVEHTEKNMTRQQEYIEGVRKLTELFMDAVSRTIEGIRA